MTPVPAMHLAISLAAGADVVAVDGLVWRWEPGATRRYYLETEVSPPMWMVLHASRNKSARVTDWQTRILVDCTATARSWRGTTLDCAVVDFAIKAAAMPGDAFTGTNEPLLGPILVETDAKISGATASLVLRDDGRLVQFEIHGLPNTERREGQMNEHLRLVLLRAFAAFDLQLPPKGAADNGVWTQSQSQLMSAPAAVGTFGGTQTVHVARSESGGHVTIESAGKGTIQLNGDSVTLACRYEGTAVFSELEGALIARSWAFLGEPTADSPGNDGRSAPPYYQHGQLAAVAADARVNVGETAEVGSVGARPTALDAWVPLGSAPPAGRQLPDISQ